MKKVLRRSISGMLCLVMVFVLAFSSLDVSADDEQVLFGINYQYFEATDSDLFVSTSGLSGPFYISKNATDNEIMDEVNSRLPLPVNVSENMKFDRWNIQIDRNYSNNNILVQANAQYTGNRENVYDVTIKSLEASNLVSNNPPTYLSYYTKVTPAVIVCTQNNDDDIKDRIIQNVENSNSFRPEAFNGFDGWEITEFDKSSRTSTVISDYRKYYTTIMYSYIQQNSTSNYLGFQGGYKTIVSDTIPSESVLASELSELEHATTLEGWTIAEETDGCLPCNKIYHLTANYDKYPCPLQIKYLNNQNDLVEKNPNEFYDKNSMVSGILEDLTTDRRNDTVFQNTDTPLPSIGKSISQMTVKEFANYMKEQPGPSGTSYIVVGTYSDKKLSGFTYPKIVHANQFPMLYGNSDDLVIGPVEYYYNYIDSDIDTIGEAVAFLQDNNIMPTLEQYKAVDSKVTGVGGEITYSVAGIQSDAPVFRLELQYNGKAATGITLSQQKISINKGGNYSLVATITPGDADNKNVIWSSDNTSVATVDNAGKVTGVSAGKATITARTEDGNYTSSCVVTVNASVPQQTQTSNNVVGKSGGKAVVKDDVSGGNATVPVEYTTQGKVYRMYDPGRGEHFYTKNAAEMQQLVNLGWHHEANADFTVVDATDVNATPVYRLYNPNGGGMHFYTENPAEAKHLKSVGWNYEGISHYVYVKTANKGVAQYRLYNPNSTNGEHNWTTDVGEWNMLKNAGWKDEGVCWKLV